MHNLRDGSLDDTVRDVRATIGLLSFFTTPHNPKGVTSTEPPTSVPGSVT